MDAKSFYLILLLVSPLWILFTHIPFARALQRINPRLSPLYATAFVILDVYFIMQVFAWVLYLRHLPLQEAVFGWLYGTLVYGGLAFSYFQFFAMTETARRIRILRELYETGPLTREQLAANYGAEQMFEIRLNRMVELGQLEKAEGRFRVKGRLILYVAKVMSTWARVLGFSKEKTR